MDIKPVGPQVAPPLSRFEKSCIKFVDERKAPAMIVNGYIRAEVGAMHFGRL